MVPASLPGLVESVGVPLEVSVGESVGEPPDDVSVGVPDDVAVGDVLLGVTLGDPDVDTVGVAVAEEDGTVGTVPRQLGAGVAE